MCGGEDAPVLMVKPVTFLFSGSEEILPHLEMTSEQGRYRAKDLHKGV